MLVHRCLMTEYVLSKVDSIIRISPQIVTYSCLPSLLWSKKSVFVGLNRYWRFVVCAHLQIISFRLLTFLSLLSVMKSLAVLVQCYSRGYLGKGKHQSRQPFLRAITTVHTHFQAPVSPSNLRVLECPKCGTSRSVYCFLGR